MLHLRERPKAIAVVMRVVAALAIREAILRHDQYSEVVRGCKYENAMVETLLSFVTSVIQGLIISFHNLIILWTRDLLLPSLTFSHLRHEFRSYLLNFRPNNVFFVIRPQHVLRHQSPMERKRLHKLLRTEADMFLF